jgi:hypothetical protein
MIFVRFLIILFASVVCAETVTISWTPPAERMNGDAITADEIGGYEVKTECNGESETAVQESSPYTSTADTFDGCEFYVRVFDTDGLYSNWVEAIEPATSGITAGPSFIGIE